MTKRIWELDALRGICILAMVAVHLVYDLGGTAWAPFQLVQRWGGTVFVALSGLCATLGRRSVSRGALVFGCGLLCTAATAAVYELGLAGKSIVIWFGVLHCLGACMVLWPLAKKCPAWALTGLGSLAVGLGLWVTRLRVAFPWLVPLGLTYPGFASSDYFPLLPNLGFFLLGAALGRVLYPARRSLLSGIRAELPPLRFLCACGRHSLAIYLAHQPVLTGILYLIHAGG